MEGLQSLFLVDQWQKQSGAYFLTVKQMFRWNAMKQVNYFSRAQAIIPTYQHMHGDHIKGLGPTWSRGPLYCSPITAQLLCVRFPGFNKQLLRPLEVGVSTIVQTWNKQRQELMEVTPIDAHHCPGSVMFLFRGSFGTRLHTGDFRWDAFLPIPSSPQDCSECDSDTEADLPLTSGLRQLQEALRGRPVDMLFLDNTYCHPKYRFPERAEALEQVCATVDAYPDHQILIGVDSLGKEDLLVEVASRLRTKIGVLPERLAFAQLLGLPEVFTLLSNPSDTAPSDRPRVCAVPRKSVNLDHLRVLNQKAPTIGILPSGWRTFDTVRSKTSDRGDLLGSLACRSSDRVNAPGGQPLNSEGRETRAGENSANKTNGRCNKPDGRSSVNLTGDLSEGGIPLIPVRSALPAVSSDSDMLTSARGASFGKGARLQSQTPLASKAAPLVRGAAAAAAGKVPLKIPQPGPLMPQEPLLFRAPYSLHSPFSELEAFVRLVKPRIIRPIAGKDPYGLDTCPTAHFGELCKDWGQGQGRAEPQPRSGNPVSGNPLRGTTKWSKGGSLEEGGSGGGKYANPVSENALRETNDPLEDEFLEEEIGMRVKRHRKRSVLPKVRRVRMHTKRPRVGSISPVDERGRDPRAGGGTTHLEAGGEALGTGVNNFEGVSVKALHGVCLETFKDVNVNVRGVGVSKPEGKGVTGPQSEPGVQVRLNVKEEVSASYGSCKSQLETAVKLDRSTVEVRLEMDVRWRLESVAKSRGGFRIDKGSRVGTSESELVGPVSRNTSQEQEVGQGNDVPTLSLSRIEVGRGFNHGLFSDKDVSGSRLPDWYLEAHERWIANVDSPKESLLHNASLSGAECEASRKHSRLKSCKRTLPFFLSRTGRS